MNIEKEVLEEIHIALRMGLIALEVAAEEALERKEPVNQIMQLLQYGNKIEKQIKFLDNLLASSE